MNTELFTISSDYIDIIFTKSVGSEITFDWYKEHIEISHAQKFCQFVEIIK